MSSTDELTDLLAQLARGIPHLPKAACRAHRDTFDAETAEGMAEAVSICGRCPELAACRAWVDGLDRRVLYGVIAGHRFAQYRSLTERNARPGLTDTSPVERAKTAVLANPTLSLRAIAELVDVGQTTVRNARKELLAQGLVVP